MTLTVPVLKRAFHGRYGIHYHLTNLGIPDQNINRPLYSMPYDKATLCIQLAGKGNIKKHEGNYKTLPFISFSVAPF